MDAKAASRYRDRDWTLVEARKRDSWAATLRRYGPTALSSMAEALREHARRVVPGWPTRRERQRDLAHHIAFKRRIDAVRDAFSAR